ncbi:MAG: ABC transporter ATP-binding protein [Planctomycetia bacterium]|nr:ABC transporter ATP-binding protein [Planctomycetia bacterium]
MPQLAVQDVTRVFPTRGEPLAVLRGCSLALEAGENVAILGPSGSGKSTLLFIIGTLDRPTAGTVTLAGQDPFTFDERRLAAFRNEQIGFVFQDHFLLPQCSVLENVLVPALAAGPIANELVERARQLLTHVGLGQRLDHRPAELSGGERQRVALARALLRRPKLLLADEPTGNLDRSTAAAVGDLLLEMQRAEATMLVVVTHSIELARRFSRQLELDGGQLKPAQIA